MMLLMLKVSDNRYGINVVEIVEVVPHVLLQKLPKSPVIIAGLLNYRGHIVPIIDGSRLMGDRSVKKCLSSRIIIIKSEKMRSSCIGFLAENVTETLKVDDSQFTDASIGEGEKSVVDKVILDENGMIQHINVTRLIPNELKSFMKSVNENESSLEDMMDGS